jgi:hypothetical protein
MNQYAGSEDFDMKKLKRLERSDAADRKIHFWNKSQNQESQQDAPMADETRENKLEEESKGHSIQHMMSAPPG